MLINSQITPQHLMTDLDTVSLPVQLVEYVALNASIPVLGLWVLLCNQKGQSQHNKNQFCQKYQLSPQAFDKAMSKLMQLDLAWRQQSIGKDDWHVANLPQQLTTQLHTLLGEMENLFAAQSLQTKPRSANQQSASGNLSSVLETNVSAVADNKSDLKAQGWDSLILAEDFYQIATTKIPAELINQYWDSFVASADKRAEPVPDRKQLFKKWKSYIANVSVNLAVSERRFSNNIQRKAQQNSLTEQKNIDAWQLLMEQRIPQELSFSAAMNNLAQVENDVWHGFIQQNIRYKNETMNPTNLRYAFEEYCKTSGQKFLRKSGNAETELDQQLNDTSWANNLDDVL